MAAQRNIQNRVLMGKQRRRRRDAAIGFFSWAPRTVAVTVAAAKAAWGAGSPANISKDNESPSKVHENIRGKK